MKSMTTDQWGGEGDPHQLYLGVLFSNRIYYNQKELIYYKSKFNLYFKIIELRHFAGKQIIELYNLDKKGEGRTTKG